MPGVLLTNNSMAQGGDLDDHDGGMPGSSSGSKYDSEDELLWLAQSDFPDMDSIEVSSCKASRCEN